MPDPSKPELKTPGRDAEATREALLDAGAELFTRDGFDGARVSAIAERAGVNPAMINYHFGGKHGLYVAILAATFEDLRERFEELWRSEEPADRQLRRFVTIFAEAARGRPALPAMIVREVITGGRHIDEDLLPYFLEVFSLVREIVQRGIKDGTFRSANPFLTHLSLIGSLTFFFITQPLRTRLVSEGKLPVELPTTDAYVRHLQELMIRGLADDESDPASRP